MRRWVSGIGRKKKVRRESRVTRVFKPQKVAGSSKMEGEGKISQRRWSLVTGERDQ
jgi:hypothetical protein